MTPTDRDAPDELFFATFDIFEDNPDVNKDGLHSHRNVIRKICRQLHPGENAANSQNRKQGREEMVQIKAR